MMKISRIEWAVIALTLFGGIIRLWNIGFQNMNYDEQFSISFANPLLSYTYIFLHSLTFDFTPPLYYMASHTSMLLFGENAAAIRIPSAIAGALLIPAMYYLGREYKDEIFGLMLAGFSTIFYNFYFYSKFGRSYSICLLFFVLAFYYFIRAMKGNDKMDGAWFGVFAVLAMWSHLYSAIPIGILILYLLWERKALEGIVIIGAGSVPLLSYVSLIIYGRSVANGTAFGYTPLQFLYLTPPEIFGFSVFLTFPIIAWILWTRRKEKIMSVISIVSLGTFLSMILLSTITPIIMHYSIFLVPILLIPLVLPFYEAIVEKRVAFVHLCVIMVIVLLECVQIVALNIYQRGGF